MDIRINLRSTALSKWSKYKSHISAKELRNLTAKVLEVLDIDLSFGSLELSVLLADDNEMQDYNARFRGINKPTNVLSFPLKLNIKDSLPHRQKFYLGDIALGFTAVSNEAQQLSVPFYNYAYYLFVHGLLHLFGYVHDKKKDRKHMESLETAILKKMNIDAQCFR